MFSFLIWFILICRCLWWCDRPCRKRKDSVVVAVCCRSLLRTEQDVSLRISLRTGWPLDSLFRSAKIHNETVIGCIPVHFLCQPDGCQKWKEVPVLFFYGGRVTGWENTRRPTAFRQDYTAFSSVEYKNIIFLLKTFCFLNIILHFCPRIY